MVYFNAFRAHTGRQVYFAIFIPCGDYGIARKDIGEDAIKDLQQHNWTGNIQELRNVVDRLIILSGKMITQSDIENYVLPKK